MPESLCSYGLTRIGNVFDLVLPGACMDSTPCCEVCGRSQKGRKGPALTVDVVVYDPLRGVLLVQRKNPPHGWALPGGFVDYGETVEHAAVRELQEETGLEVTLAGVLGVYSAPDRDPRQHTISVVFMGTPVCIDDLQAGDDALEAFFFPLNALPAPVVFDHAGIIADFIARTKAEAV